MRVSHQGVIGGKNQLFNDHMFDGDQPAHIAASGMSSGVNSGFMHSSKAGGDLNLSINNDIDFQGVSG